MKILIHTGFIGKNAIFMQFYIILPDITLFTQLALNDIRDNWRSSSRSNNHKLLAEFHSGTLRIIDTMRLMLSF